MTQFRDKKKTTYNGYDFCTDHIKTVSDCGTVDNLQSHIQYGSGGWREVEDPHEVTLIDNAAVLVHHIAINMRTGYRRLDAPAAATVLIFAAIRVELSK